jgi:hypothetical protein
MLSQVMANTHARPTFGRSRGPIVDNDPKDLFFGKTTILDFRFRCCVDGVDASCQADTGGPGRRLRFVVGRFR